MEESPKYELAVVIPAYNEEDCIANVINKWTLELRKLNINFQIHVYNDGSTDDTLQILNKLASKNENLVIHNKLNSGHGPTIIQGYRENSEAEWIFQIDADDEIGTESFKELWQNRNKYHFLIGKRVRPHQPFTRKLISFISRLVVRTLYGNRVYDVNSPYRLMKTEKFKDIFLILPEKMFAPNLVISGVASLRKLDVYEVPVKHRERTTGVSSIKNIQLIKASLISFFQTVMFRFKFNT